MGKKLERLQRMLVIINKLKGLQRYVPREELENYVTHRMEERGGMPVSPSARLPDSHSTVAPPHLGQKASLSCKIRLQFSHFFIVFLPIFSKIRIQCCNFSRMCRFRNIILQQKIPHVKTFFRPLRFYPFFVRIHHGTVSACIVRTNAQIKTDSFCRPGRNCRQNFVKTLPTLLVAFNYVRYRRIPEILRYFPNYTNVAANL